MHDDALPPQGEQSLPPQSTASSSWSLAKLLQCGSRQTPPVHSPEAQSELMRQSWPLTQWAHVAPPQSTSVSVPFLSLSLHDESSRPAIQSAGAQALTASMASVPVILPTEVRRKSVATMDQNTTLVTPPGTQLLNVERTEGSECVALWWGRRVGAWVRSSSPPLATPSFALREK